MSNFVYVIWKIGDQSSDNSGIKHGMPICWLDPDIIHQDQISDNMKKCFGITMEPKSQLAFIQDMMLPNMEETFPLLPNYRTRKKLLEFSNLELETGISDLEDQWKSAAIVEPIDRSMQMSLLIKDSDTLYPPTPDTNAIYSGSYTFGAGGDYIDLVAACADLGSPFSGDVTLSQISSMTLTATPAVTVLINNNHLTITNTNPHYGNYNNGYKIYSNVLNGRALYLPSNIANDAAFKRCITVEHLNIEAGPDLLYGIYIADSGNQWNVSQKEIFFNNILLKGSNVSYAIRCDKNEPLQFRVENSMIWNWANGLYSQAWPSRTFQRFNTVYNCASRGFSKDSNYTNEYNAVFDCGTLDYYRGPLAGPLISCASSDGSGSAGFINLVSATEFESVVDTDGDSFLRPKYDNITLNAASLHTDIFGNDSTFIGAKGANLLPPPTPERITENIQDTLYKGQTKFSRKTVSSSALPLDNMIGNWLLNDNL